MLRQQGQRVGRLRARLCGPWSEERAAETLLHSEEDRGWVSQGVCSHVMRLKEAREVATANERLVCISGFWICACWENTLGIWLSCVGFVVDIVLWVAVGAL